ncbi:hypothetical protein SM033_00040 [Vibrio phage vB_VpaM_sm033]|nr:hypothetical protein SM033_00040 [Vibrio phage vB_VpaM_sm033]
MSFLYIQNDVNYEVQSGYQFNSDYDLRARNLKILDASTGDNKFSYYRQSHLIDNYERSKFPLRQFSTEKGILWLHFCATSAGGNPDIRIGKSNIALSTFNIWVSVTSTKLVIQFMPDGSSAGQTQISFTRPGGAYNIDIRMNNNTGKVAFWADEQFQGEATVTKMQQLDWRNLSHGIICDGSITQMVLTEDEETIGMRVIEHVMENEGVKQEAEGSYSDLGEELTQDAFKFYGPGKQNFAVGDVKGGVDMDKYEILAVGVGSVADAQATAAAKHLKNTIMFGSNDHYTVGAGTNLDENSALGTHQDILLTNPHTGLPWTKADLNSMQVGVEISKGPNFTVNVVSMLGFSGRYGVDQANGSQTMHHTADDQTEMLTLFRDGSTKKISLEFDGTKQWGGKTNLDATFSNADGVTETVTFIEQVGGWYQTDAVTSTKLDELFKDNSTIFVTFEE